MFYDKMDLRLFLPSGNKISKIFDKYCQISSRFTTHSIEFQLLSKDAASEIKTQVNKISVMRVFSFQLKT